MNKFIISLPFQRFVGITSKRSRLCWDVMRTPPLASINAPSVCIHTSRQHFRKPKKELSSEPTKFTSSAANTSSMPLIPETTNPYQPFIVSFSLLVFLIYFLVLREENDLDESLNIGLFERVPHLEEPHLMQAIPRMRDAGIDTREAEMRLKELREKRLGIEAKQKEH